jgi:hypothetical protein
VDGGSPPRLVGDELEDAGHLATGECDKGQLFFGVAVVVADGFEVGLGVSGCIQSVHEMYHVSPLH